MTSVQNYWICLLVYCIAGYFWENFHEFHELKAISESNWTMADEGSQRVEVVAANDKR